MKTIAACILASVGVGVLAVPGSAAPASGSAAAAVVRPPALASVDFDSDGRTDFGLYRGSASLWYAPGSSSGAFQIYFGAATDVPVPGDYDGDGKTDAVIFRPSTGLWYGPRTGAASIVIQTIVGQSGDVPVPGDYDGDGKMDPAVYRPSTGLFFAVRSGGGTQSSTFGAVGDVPVPRDYDGDGRTDFAIFRPSLGLWYAPLSGGGVYQIYFGSSGDTPVPGDYNGDGRAEATIFRASSGLWYGPYNGAPGVFQLTLGQSGDVPIPGYYDDDAAVDPAIFRPSTGLWFALQSGGGIRTLEGLGSSSDVPIQRRPVLPGGDLTPPSTPTGLSVSSPTTTSLTLSWSASSDNVGVSGYGRYRDGVLVSTGTSRSYTYSGLTCGTTYVLGVDAYDAAGNRSPLATTTGTTSACAPPPPPPTGCPTLLTAPPPGYCTGRVISVTPSTFGTGIFGTGGFALLPGDVVVFEDGIYRDTGTDGTVVQVNTGGTSSQYVTFVSRTRWGARLDGNNNTSKYGFSLAALVANVRIEGFDIFGFGSRDVGTLVAPSASGVFLQAGGDNSQVVGNAIHNISNFCNDTVRAQTGVFVQRSGVLVENNLFYGIGRFDPGENGCSYSGTFNKYKNSDTGVYLQSPGHSNVTIRNNLFSKHENGFGVFVYQGGSSSLKVLNNTFSGGNPYCRNAHVFTDADMIGFELKNNVFHDAAGGYAWAWDLETLTNVTAANNVGSGGLLVSGANCSSAISPLPSGVTESSNKWNQSVGLVDPNAPLTGGHRLQASSPAIDAGTNLAGSGLTLDYEGSARPQGAAYDAGAYEYGGAPPPPPSGDTQPPTVPGGLAKTSGTTSSITVSWSASSDNVGVAGYGLYRNGSSTGSTSSTTATFSGLACGTSYTLSVDAYDAAGNRSAQASISASTSACPPPPPSGCPTLSTPTPVPGYCTGRVISVSPSSFGSGVFGSGGIAVAPGDVVVFEDGTYTDTNGDGAVMTIRGSGTASQWVTFVSRTKWGAHMWGNNNAAAEGIALAGADYVRVEGFEVSDVGNVGSPRGSASGIDLYNGGFHSQIVGNHVHHVGRVCADPGNTNGQVGIYVQSGKGGGSIVVENNLVHDIGRFFVGENGCGNTTVSLDHGMYLNGSTGGGGGAGNVTIRNNIFHDTHHGWGVQFYPGSLDNIHVLNNTFAFCNESKSYTCIVLDASITNSSIKNNVFYNPQGGKTIEAAGFGGSIIVGNNVTSGSAMHDQSSTPGGMTLQNNLLNTNALLANPPADFQLRSGSPAIDRGETLSSVVVDHAGRSRPSGCCYDVGAYEYAG